MVNKAKRYFRDDMYHGRMGCFLLTLFEYFVQIRTYLSVWFWLPLALIKMNTILVSHDVV
jgi:hypothetical protein